MGTHFGAVSNKSIDIDNKENVRRAAKELRYHQAKIAEVIQLLVVDEGPSNIPGFPATREDLEIAQSIRRVLSLRDKRSALFGKDLFADPAWDILLELFLCHLNQRRLTVSRACALSRVPPTTALRWLKALEDRDFIARHPDPKDGRQIFVRLTTQGLQLMREFSYGLGPAGKVPSL